MQHNNRSTFESLEGRALFSAGNLDPSFGTGGLVTQNIGDSDSAAAVFVLPSGRTLVAGTSGDNFVLSKFRKDGTPDTSFGGGDGHVETDMGGYDNATAIAFDAAANKIVVVGSSYSQYTDTSFAVARYKNSDGSLDKTFSDDGKKVFGFTVDTFYGDVSDDGCYANGVLLQNGKIVVTGTVRYQVPNYSGTDSAFGLARLKSDGSFDASFAGGGQTTYEFWNNQPYQYDEATCLTKANDGGFYIGGRNNEVMGVAKFKADGNYDPGFGNSGHMTIDLGTGFESIASMDVRTTGDLIVVGTATKNGKSAWGLAMVKPNGTLQQNFDGDGKKVLALGGTVSQYATAVAFQPEGHLVVAGTGSLFSSKSDFSVVRFNPNGNIDENFGTGLNGFAWADFGGTSDIPGAIDIGADGRIVVAGTKTLASGKTDIALSRHIGKPTTLGFTAIDSVAVEGSNNVAKVRIRRYDDLSQPLTVKLAAAGTASAADYNFNTTFPVTFAVGQSEIFIEVKAKADAKVEPTETVKLSILNDPFYQYFGGDVVVNIEDAN